MHIRLTVLSSVYAAVMSFASLDGHAVVHAQDRADDAARPFDFEEASRDVPKPREVYPFVKRDMIPMDLQIVSDEIVVSDTDPSKKLRKIVARFSSL